MDVVEWIQDAFPNGFDKDTGHAMWTAFVNRDVYLPNGELIQGSFRWWGARVAEARDSGEDYLDYYCGYANEALVRDIERILESKGWQFKHEEEICPICNKPIGRWDTVAIDIMAGRTTHATCALDDDEKNE